MTSLPYFCIPGLAGTGCNKNLSAKDAGCAGNKITEQWTNLGRCRRWSEVLPAWNKMAKLDTKPTFGPNVKPQTASIKTVGKWEKELGISLEYETSSTDENIVTQIWCKVCRHHSRDKTSSIRQFYFSVKLGKRGYSERRPLGQHESLYPSQSFPLFFCLTLHFYAL